MLTPGRLIHGRYRVIEHVGMGGMGAVYKALDIRLKTVVALKHMLVSPAPEYIEAFRREAQLLARLQHPALPRVHDHFAEPDGHFLVMDLIEGPDLAALLLDRAGTFEVSRALAWADRLLDALIYLHSQHPLVIHRDIKPQNLKLAADGQIVLLDFGLAKGALNSVAPGHSGISMAGYSVQYAPLEQIGGTGTDVRSDLYALAATLYHVLTGQPPPSAPVRASAVLAGRADPLLPIRACNPAVPEAVDQALRQALALHAEQRQASALELRAALDTDTARASVLEQIAGSAPIAPVPPGTPLDPLAGAAPIAEAHASQAPQSSARLPWRWWLMLALALAAALGLVVAPSVTISSLFAASAFAFLAWTALRMLIDQVRRQRHSGELGSHPAAVLAVAYAPNGRLVASSADDGSLAIWQPGGRRLIRLWSSHRAPVRQLCFTPDGEALISASSDGVVCLWQARDGALVYTLAGHVHSANQVAVSPDGLQIALAADDGTVRLWQARDGQPLLALGVNSESVLAVAFAPNGEVLAAAGEDGLARIWRVRDGQLLHELKGHQGAICALAFSPDSRTLATGSRDSLVWLWRVQDGARLATLKGHAQEVGGVLFHPDGTLLATRSEDGTVGLWRVRDGKRLQALGVAEQVASSAIAFAQGGDMLVAGARDGTLRLWRVRDGQPHAPLRGHRSRILALAAHPDGHLLATGSLDRSVRLWPV